MDSTRFFIPTSGAKTWVQEFLPLKPKAMVVFADGAGYYRSVDTLANWAQALWWAKQECALTLFDPVGCGKSEGDWDSADLGVFKEQLRQVLLAVRTKHPGIPVILYGQSQGSLLGFELAAEGAVDGLIARVAGEQDSYEAFSQYIYTEVEKRPWAYDLWIEAVQGPGPNTDLVLGYPLGYWRSCIRRPKVTALLPQIKNPVFALNGQADLLCPAERYRSIHRGIQAGWPGSHPLNQAREYPEVGHMLRRAHELWEQSQAALHIEAWVQSVLSEP